MGSPCVHHTCLLYSSLSHLLLGNKLSSPVSYLLLGNVVLEREGLSAAPLTCPCLGSIAVAVSWTPAFRNHGVPTVPGFFKVILSPLPSLSRSLAVTTLSPLPVTFIFLPTYNYSRNLSPGWRSVPGTPG
jgi:hypothetical protein